MKTYQLDEAHMDFAGLVDRALAGDPQRVTCAGNEAVVIVSEKEWLARGGSPPTLGSLLARHARAGLMSEPVTDRPLKDRPLGQDVE
jgi:prevent-host-death family protein